MCPQGQCTSVPELVDGTFGLLAVTGGGWLGSDRGGNVCACPGTGCAGGGVDQGAAGGGGAPNAVMPAFGCDP
jgi:hypothetical protein